MNDDAWLFFSGWKRVLTVRAIRLETSLNSPSNSGKTRVLQRRICAFCSTIMDDIADGRAFFWRKVGRQIDRSGS